MLKMTYDIAMAIGKDEANRNMKKQGRTKWNREDYNVAAETFNRLYPEGSEFN